MTTKRIVGYVVSHSGTKAGPFEAIDGAAGTAAETGDRFMWTPEEYEASSDNGDRRRVLGAVRAVHPRARVVRVVRVTGRVKARVAHLEWAIRTGGAAVRAERALLGVPGGIDHGTVLRDAVVEAALRWEAAPPGNDSGEICVMYAAIRALRVHEKGTKS